MSKHLVSYSSSEDEGNLAQPTLKKRKLPSLASTIVPPPPVDNPALHQGRVRAVPHVDGQFSAHVYVSLPVEESPLSQLVGDVLGCATKLVPRIRASAIGAELKLGGEFHISLSRPTYLRSHQREDLKRAVKALTKQQPPFSVSFASFSEITNDERTRMFLIMEVGAGHHELKTLANSLTPTLSAMRQQEFYVDPRFHASIGWVLVNLSNENPTSAPHFPPSLLSNLNDKYGARLASIGTFDVCDISVKIGREVCKWRLVG